VKEAAMKHAPWAVTLVTVLGALYPFWTSLTEQRAQTQANRAEVVKPINACADLLEDHDRMLWEVNRRLVWLEQARKASQGDLVGAYEPGHLLMPPPRRKLSRLDAALAGIVDKN